jgi:hypothetical protein
MSRPHLAHILLRASQHFSAAPPHYPLPQFQSMNQIIRQLEARLSESSALNAQQQQRHSEILQQQLQQQQHHHAEEVRVLQQKLDAATAAAAASSLEAQTARAQVADMDAKASDAHLQPREPRDVIGVSCCRFRLISTLHRTRGERKCRPRPSCRCFMCTL